jgi:hypothetical protein
MLAVFSLSARPNRFGKIKESLKLETKVLLYSYVGTRSHRQGGLFLGRLGIFVIFYGLYFCD